MRVQVGESMGDVRTLGTSPARVVDYEGGVGNAGLSGVVKGVGVAQKLVLMLQMTITMCALAVQR